MHGPIFNVFFLFYKLLINLGEGKIFCFWQDVHNEGEGKKDNSTVNVEGSVGVNPVFKEREKL